MGILIPITELTNEQMSDYRKNIANDLVNAVSNKSRIDSDRLVLRAQDPVGDFGFTAGSEWTMTSNATPNTLTTFAVASGSSTVTPGVGYAFYGLSIQTVGGGPYLTKIQFKKGVTPIDELFAWDIRQMLENFPAGIMNKAQIYVEDDEIEINHAHDTASVSSQTPYYGLTCEQSGETFVQ
jgi:hypothetical protein